MTVLLVYITCLQYYQRRERKWPILAKCTSGSLLFHTLITFMVLWTVAFVAPTMGASSLPHRRQLGHDNQVSITSITTTITITNSNSKSKENKYNHLANSQSWLRSLQASLEQDSILLEILQGSSGEEYASQNDGWNNTTPGALIGTQQVNGPDIFAFTFSFFQN